MPVGPLPEVTIRNATLDDVDAIAALETVSFPPDEAASREKMLFRVKEAGLYFRVACWDPSGDDAGNTVTKRGDIVGFVCSTVSRSPLVTHAAMEFEHDPSGETACVHSVAVLPALRRRGLATHMLREYLKFLNTITTNSNNSTGSTGESAVVRAALICKENLIGLYERGGFSLVGPSKVVHGADQWYDMTADVAKQKE